MRSLLNSRIQKATDRPVAAIFAAVMVAYPFLVYALRERVSFSVFALVAIGLLLLRACFATSGMMALLRLPLILAAIGLAFLTIIDAALAAKAYPALLSLMFAALFGNSLRRPPSLIERMDAMRDPNPSPAAQNYCRRLTWIWTVWLTANAVIAALLAALHNIDLWLLWTGLISYICSGGLFLGEVLLRPWFLLSARHRGRDA